MIYFRHHSNFIMLKICIVTVYNSINSGSFWQAYVLGKVLEQQGYQVQYLKRKGDRNSSNTLKAAIKRIVKSIIKRGVHSGMTALKQYLGFSRSWKCFSLYSGTDYSDIDCFVLGSDTIWNIESKYFLDNRETYWGNKFSGHTVISYATSVGNTKKEFIDKFPELVGYLNRLTAISVRDNHTFEIVSKITDKNVTLVCDPTLLWDINDYRYLIGEDPNVKYIFLYLFAPLSEHQIEEVKNIALQRDLQVISGTEIGNFPDKTIVNTPYEFLKYMYYADFVITDTFHGTIFSANFLKKFVVIDRGKDKVNEFLKRVNLLDKLVSDADIVNVLEKEINYDEVNKILEQEREHSILYLQNSIGGGENDSAE